METSRKCFTRGTFEWRIDLLNAFCGEGGIALMNFPKTKRQRWHLALHLPDYSPICEQHQCCSFQGCGAQAYYAVVHCLYVHDYLDSVSTEKEAVKRAHAVIRIHDDREFQIRYWASSSKHLRSVTDRGGKTTLWGNSWYKMGFYLRSIYVCSQAKNGWRKTAANRTRNLACSGVTTRPKRCFKMTTLFVQNFCCRTYESVQSDGMTR